MNTKPETRQGGARGLTLIEVMVVVVVVVVIVLLLGLVDFGALAQDKSAVMRAQCQNNLKQVGLAFRAWGTEHADRNPMSVSTNDGGSMEWLAGSNLFRHFQVMSDEINNSKIIVCPSDERQPAHNLLNLANTNLSYFLGLDADETLPGMWLAGDRNLVTNGVDVRPGLAVLSTNYNTTWSQKMHNLAGNVLLSDCSVQQSNGKSLQGLLHNTGTNINRLAVP